MKTDLPYDYVAPALDIPTPTREEIINGGYLTRKIVKFVRPLLSLNVLAAPAGLVTKKGRWALPAGELFYAIEGLAFITQGKRIGMAEQFLGGSLFWIYKNVGQKFAEPVLGKAFGEELVKTVSDTHEWYERLEELGKYSEGIEHRESLFLPINRIVSLSLPFEPRNQYGISQLNIVVQGESDDFKEYEVLAREEDGSIFREQIAFIYFLRLNYEQRCFQKMLFNLYSGGSLETPDNWSFKTLSYKPDFYQRAAAALPKDAQTVSMIRQEALVRSHNVISRLRKTQNQQFNLDTPSGKLFDIGASSA